MTADCLLRAGAGLKPEHQRHILEARPDIGWFEVHAENYMGAGGPPHHFLERVRTLYPLSIHGVGLSIGSAQGMVPGHLARLKSVVERYQPFIVSEHLAWSTHDGIFLNDLLPLPYTEATLSLVERHVDEAQTVLRRRILIENPSTYLRFDGEEMPETDFLRALARRSGCGLLLDVNNVVVSAANHGFDPMAYLATFPVEHVGEIHLAGHAVLGGARGAPAGRYARSPRSTRSLGSLSPADHAARPSADAHRVGFQRADLADPRSGSGACGGAAARSR